MASQSPLVTTAWLDDNLTSKDVKIVDGSWRLDGGASAAHAAYVQNRIPGAVFFDLDLIADQNSPLPHMLPSPQKFADGVSTLGIKASDLVVVYDEAGLFSAARVWWTFKVMGHDKVAVLNGGLPKWVQEGRATETGAPRQPEAADYGKANLASARVLSAIEVQEKIQNPRDTLIVDARPAGRFRGETPEPRAGLRGGAMPGAVNVPHSDLLKENGELKSPAALEAVFNAQTVTKDRPVVASCGSGVTAAVIILALESLGWTDHALYDGSWAEWGAMEGADNRPVVKASAG